MRGTQQLTDFDIDVIGIIPAYAGNTPALCVFISLLRDHPRVCGEHADSTEADAKGLGSSPRMRGTPNKAPQ